ncbi:hypothetical protein SAPIO_CDS7583 [Scedosporium apiospermum]|uniref:Uncharacterized protein n=1 Tax=Pseudallescheria apiosperma TaxID=563466 RepID=A0A084G288_PSEDA|nr:uncharacterized protein SAPIO_CDS7583 [Scedosporium apiospermum]KEZ41450.1 hypothetical protein SAPIO_CDS7583 [Scedosporium apiospermum]
MVSTSPRLYAAYKSVYGPKYHYQPNFKGYTATQLTRVGFATAKYGAAALVAVIFYASGIPRVQKDVLSYIPVLGPLTEKPAIPESDNPF